jgi:hypothetical protein
MRGIETTASNTPFKTWRPRLIRQLRLSPAKLDKPVNEKFANGLKKKLKNEAHVQPLLSD